MPPHAAAVSIISRDLPLGHFHMNDEYGDSYRLLPVHADNKRDMIDARHCNCEGWPQLQSVATVRRGIRASAAQCGGPQGQLPEASRLGQQRTLRVQLVQGSREGRCCLLWSLALGQYAQPWHEPEDKATARLQQPCCLCVP
eukprot:COSAG06_NODE_1536_length_9152_cov_19.634044_4_plen_142_part_00